MVINKEGRLRPSLFVMFVHLLKRCIIIARSAWFLFERVTK